jgi:outer membrane lipase/esterase
MRTTKLAIGAVALALFAGTAAAKPFTQLWVFGDSSVDTGSYRIAPYSGNPNFDVYLAPTTLGGKTGAQKWGIGKPTSYPGLMNTEVLAQLLDVGAAPQNQGGTNYAFSGARNALANKPCPQTKCGFPNAIPTVVQIGDYLSDHIPSGRELFLISSGGNDVTYALDHNPSCDANAQSYLTTAAQDLANALFALQSSGARYIFVANKAKSGGSQTALCSQFYQASIEDDLSSLGVIYVLAGKGLGILIEGSSSTFGISILGLNNPACPEPAAATNITTAWALVCSPTSPISKDSASIAAKSEYADDQHYATGAQKVEGGYYYCLAKNTWPALFVGFSNDQLPPFPCHIFNASWR